LGIVVVDGVLGHQSFQGQAVHGGGVGLAAAEHVFQHRPAGIPHQKAFVGFVGFPNAVAAFRMKRQPHVGGQGPGGGGPNQNVDFFPVGPRQFLGVLVGRPLHHGELDENRRGRFGVFHFRFGQGGFAMGAPIDGFAVLHHVALFQEVVKGFNDARFVVRLKRFVGMVPFAQNAQTFKFAFLNVDPVFGVAGGFLTERHAPTFRLSQPFSFMSWCSMGRPWQSQPGM
jgi:hypothetical protein